MKKLSSFLTYSFTAASIALSGCTPEKARTLHTAAMQFKVESLDAINAIDQMIEQETSPPQRSEEEIRREFINNILNTEREITPEIVEFAINPYTVNLSVEVAEEKTALINNLQNQYIEFTTIFDRLESGSFLATPAVEETEILAKKLTLQMANFANSILENPPQFLQLKAPLIVELEQLRNEYQMLSSLLNFNDVPNRSETETRRQEIEEEIGELMEEWLRIKSEEQKLAEATAKECLEAATLGQQLSVLIQDYDQLSLNEIEVVIFQAFDAAASISNLNYDLLKAQTQQVLEFLNNDPYFKDITVEISKQNIQQPSTNVSNTLGNKVLEFPSLRQ